MGNDRYNIDSKKTKGGCCVANQPQRYNSSGKTGGARRRRRPPKKNHDFLKLIVLLAVLVFILVLILTLSKCRSDKPSTQPSETKTETLHSSETVTDTEQTEPVETSDEPVGTDVLAKFSTDNYGGYNRTVNLQLACEAINGTVVQPNAVFSFNKTVGERTEEKGYLPASIYSAGDVKEETGGGICQVASTIYLVAMKADMEIIERHTHQFAVNYIPLGMDASIYWGDQDLRFRNTSGHPIIIYADTANACVNVSIVGTKKDTNYIFMDHEIIETYEPKEREKIDWSKDSGYREVTQTPITGYYVQSYRCLYSEDDVLLSRTKMAISVYNSRDKIITVGPPEPETEPATEPATEPTDAPFPEPPDGENE